MFVIALSVVPHVGVISGHSCLLRHDHGSAVALQPQAFLWRDDFCHKCPVAEQVHSRLTVQENDIPQREFHLDSVSLLEQVCNRWLEFSVHLSELELEV